MKVLLVTGSYPPLRCGVGDYTRQLALALARLPDVFVTVLTSVGAEEAASSAVSLLPVMKTWSLREIGKVLRIVRRRRPDVVHVQYPTQGYGDRLLPFLIPALARLAGTKVVQTWHEPLDEIGLRWRCGVRSQIVVVRPDFRDLLSPAVRTRIGPRELHLVDGASTLPAVELSDGERRSLRETYLRGQRRLIVFFGFVYPQKGVELLFEAARPATDHLVVAGQVGDEAHAKRLHELARGRWADKVTFAGFLSGADASSLLAVADAVVLPFRHGGGTWNSSIHAAVASGAYVVTTTRGSPRYDDAHRVAYVAIDDVDAMRAAIDAGVDRPSGRHRDDGGWEAAALRHEQIYALESP